MDEELAELVASELVRLIATLEEEPGVETARRAAHAMRGSLGLVGEREAASAFSRLERRLAGGEASAVDETRSLLTQILERVRTGAPLATSVWPEPPQDLRPSVVPEAIADDYVAEVRARLSSIDAALLDEDEDYALDEIYRAVHTLKGAALSASDEVMGWFCHGLEDRLKLGRGPDGDTAAALGEIRAYRGVLAELLEAPENALATLRLLSGVPVHASRPPVAVNLPLPPRRPDLLGGESRPPIEEEALRVSASTLDVLVEQATNLGVLRVPLSASSEELAAAAREARGLAGQIREALRLIGPPKPWGAPARALSMLAQVADRLGAITAVLDGTEKRVGAVRARVAEQSEVVSSTIAGLRTRTAAGLFSQVEQHADSEARRLGKEIGVERSGADTPIDRRLSDALVEPIRQLMRNAIAHGIELPEDRRARGKPPAGRVRLSAEQQGTSLLITISDDGRGVDLGLLRERAITLGLVSRLTAETLSDAALLTLLFYPGFSMREEVDLLAGRGVGLDLTLAAVHRLGGSIHLDSKVGAGLTATIAVPASRGLTRVLWVRSASRLFALPVANVREVLSERRAGARVLTLAAALPEAIAPGPPSSPRRSPVLIGISSTLGRDEAVIAVDEALGIDDVVLRPVASFVRTTGPFSGAIAWGDEIRLALDPLRLVQLASVGPM